MTRYILFGSLAVVVLLAGLFLVTGCASKLISVNKLSQAEALKLGAELPTLLDPLLRKHVDKDGMVKYAAIRQDPSTIDKYIDVMGKVSPLTHPKLFPSKEDRLAYWINGYNAAVIKNVLRFPSWKNLDSLARKAGFFAFTKFSYGGKTFNLRDLENAYIRPTFQEPRIHFALNCASFGCPKLPAEAFVGSKLNAQLDRETKRFFAEKRNVRVEASTKTIYLSSILKWYRVDFTSYLKAKNITSKASDAILTYINLYRAKEAQLPLQGHNIKYVNYDWRINDQDGPKRDK